MTHEQCKQTNRRNRPHEDNRLWFSMSSSEIQQQVQERASEQSIPRATSHQRSKGFTSSTFSAAHVLMPSISTPADVSKPLPLLPFENERRRCNKPTALRSLLRHCRSSHLDQSCLPSGPHLQHRRHFSATDNLHMNTHDYNRHSHTRSMPCPQYQYDDAATPSGPPSPSLARSNTGNYQGQIRCQPCPAQCEHQPSARQPVISIHLSTETIPPHIRTFPSTVTLNTATRNSSSSTSRPHTALANQPFYRRVAGPPIRGSDH